VNDLKYLGIKSGKLFVDISFERNNFKCIFCPTS